MPKIFTIACIIATSSVEGGGLGEPLKRLTHHGGHLKEDTQAGYRRMFSLVNERRDRAGEERPNCFPPGATVQVENVVAPVRLDNVKVGDRILTANADGSTSFADVLMFFDAEGADSNISVEYLRIGMDDGKYLEMTGKHKVYAGAECCSQASLRAAETVQEGETLYVVQPGATTATAVSAAHVQSIETVTRKGKYDLATTNGDALVVDGVVVSFLTTCPFGYCNSGMSEQELDAIRTRMVAIFASLYKADPQLAEDLSAHYRRNNFQTWKPIAEKLTVVLTECNGSDACDHAHIVNRLGSSVHDLPVALKHQLFQALLAQNVGGMAASAASAGVGLWDSVTGQSAEDSLITEAIASKFGDMIVSENQKAAAEKGQEQAPPSVWSLWGTDKLNRDQITSTGGAVWGSSKPETNKPGTPSIAIWGSDKKPGALRGSIWGQLGNR